MAYLCTGCEAGEHPALSYSEMRDLSASRTTRVHTITAHCGGCHSNTVHVSDDGDLFD